MFSQSEIDVKDGPKSDAKEPSPFLASDAGGTVQRCVPGDARGDAVDETHMGRPGDIGGTGETGFEMGGDTRGDAGGDAALPLRRQTAQ